MAWELKSNARWRPVTPKPNAVKYKVPLTNKKASGRLILLARKEPEGNQKSYKACSWSKDATAW
jgi:hypothetical protein